MQNLQVEVYKNSDNWKSIGITHQTMYYTTHCFLTLI